MREAIAGLGKPALVAAAVAAVIGGVGAATAATLITGKQIKDGSVTNADIKTNTLTGNRFKGGAAGLLGGIGTTSADSKYRSTAGPQITSGSETQLFSLSIPKPGSYLILANVNIFKSGTLTYLTSCWLRSEGQEHRAETMLQGADDAAVSMQLTITATTDTVAALSCTRDVGPDAVGSNGITLTAVKIDSETHSVF